MAKENKAVEEQTNNDPSSKIEAIKNLIFGDNIAAYNSEFDQVKKDILSKKAELEEFIEDTRKELLQSIDNLSTDLNIRITELEDSLNDKADLLESKKVDKKSLGELLISLGEKIKDK